ARTAAGEAGENRIGWCRRRVGHRTTSGRIPVPRNQITSRPFLSMAHTLRGELACASPGCALALACTRPPTSSSAPANARGRPPGRPLASPVLGSAGGAREVGSLSPHVDAGEQEQPHDVDEVPVPGGELEAEVVLGCELAVEDADQA